MLTEIKKLYHIALEIATTAHDGQTDKAGAPYIQHPIRVAHKCYEGLYHASYSTVDDEIFAWKCCIVALLHDTIEDTSIIIADLLQQFPPELVDAVLSVSRIEGESYSAFVKRAAENEIGKYVKYYDLTDNLDLTRLGRISETDVPRINKYLKWHKFLENIIYDGKKKYRV